jgi:glutamate dehydrogenase
LFDELMASDVPDSEYLVRDLKAYFPSVLGERYPECVEAHQLRREIIATVLASRVVNDGGIVFVHRITDNTGTSADLVVRAFIATDAMFGLDGLRRQIDTLDNRVSANIQMSLYRDVFSLLRRQVLWFLRHGLQTDNGHATLSIDQTTKRYSDGIRELSENLNRVMSDTIKDNVAKRVSHYVENGVDEGLASAVVSLVPLKSVCDIIDVTQESGQPLQLAAQSYFALGERIGLDELREQAASMGLAEHWERLAVRRIVDDLYYQQRLLTQSVLHTKEQGDGTVLDAWSSLHRSSIDRATTLLTEMEGGSGLTAAKLSLAGSQIRELSALVSSGK